VRRDDLRRLERLEQAHGDRDSDITEIWFVPVSRNEGKLTEGEPILFWQKQ